MSFLEVALLLITGFFAGIANAVAGGGTFFTFAAMVGFGMPTLNANATSAIALVPGSLATTIAYLPETKKNWRKSVPFALLGIAGGVIGAWLLVAIGDEGFRPLVPWLIALATVTFAFSAGIRRAASRVAGQATWPMRIAAFALMSAVAVYGGFFGAGMGIMLLATLAIIEEGDFHKANSIKNIVATVSQAVAAVLFIWKGLVVWPQMLVTVTGCIAGGYLGVLAARRVPEKVVRGVVVAVGATLSIVFLLR